MKCLIIASDIGFSAPGIVYETIIKELSKTFDIYVISLKVRNRNNIPVHFLDTKRTFSVHRIISNLSLYIFGRSLFDEYWLYKQKKHLDYEMIKEQDVIISFASFHNYKSILLGYLLSKKFNKKWIIYSVDAIPAPIGWVKSIRFHNKAKKFISKYISYCDAFFSANKQMLMYQVSFLDKLPPITGLVYTPISKGFSGEKLRNDSNENPTFLYTGGIYGPRKKEALLDGFRKFLIDYPNAKMIFVGISNSKAFSQYTDLLNSNHLEVHDRTYELDNYYNQATALIDINAYFDNDVYLSSKIVNYLPICKPIISVTGFNSPSRNIFTDDMSIIHCSHDSNEVYECLKYVSTQSFNYQNRNKYIEMFSSENVVKELCKTIVQ